MAEKLFELSDEDEKAFEALKDDPAPEEAPVEEATTEEEGEPEVVKEAEPEKKTSMVPHQALHEERERRKAIERDLQQAREERARFDERLRVIQEMQKPAPKADEMPDPNADPIGAIAWMQERMSRQAEETGKQAEERRQADEQTRAWQRALGETQREWQAAASDDPTLTEAYSYLTQSRASELRAFGLQDHEIAQTLQNEEAGAIMHARQTGRSFATIVKGYAEARGWKSAPVEAPKDNSAAEAIERVSEAQSRGKSLSQAGGGATPTEMTADRLLKMSNTEFNEWCEKHPKQASKLMGA